MLVHGNYQKIKTGILFSVCTVSERVKTLKSAARRYMNIYSCCLTYGSAIDYDYIFQLNAYSLRGLLGMERLTLDSRPKILSQSATGDGYLQTNQKNETICWTPLGGE